MVDTGPGPGPSNLWHSVCGEIECYRSDNSAYSSASHTESDQVAVRSQHQPQHHFVYSGVSVSDDAGSSAGSELSGSVQSAADPIARGVRYSHVRAEASTPLQTTPATPAAPAAPAEPASINAVRVSELHEKGECKPCSFFLKKAGCINGDNCTYCHLCQKKPKARLGKVQRHRYNRMADSILEKLKQTPPEEHCKLIKPVVESGHNFLRGALRRRGVNLAEFGLAEEEEANPDDEDDDAEAYPTSTVSAAGATIDTTKCSL